jgi:PAS domain S-box-containing protein
MMRLSVAVKMGIVLGLELLLILGSFGYLVYFENTNSLIGNAINIAGKNRYLTATVLLQTQYYVSGTAGKAAVETSLANLKANIFLLENGGVSDQANVSPLAPQFQTEWDDIYQNYLALEAETNRVLAVDIASGEIPAITPQINAGNKLVKSSDLLVSDMGESVQENSTRLVSIQVALGMLNVAVVLIIFYLVLWIIRPIKSLTKAASEVSRGNLDVQVPSKSNDELGELAETFNKMSRSVRLSAISLMEQKKKYQLLYDTAPDLYRSVDKNGILLDCNSAYLKHLGYERKEEVIGKSIFESTAESSLQAMQQSLRIWQETGVVDNREIRLKRKDGSTFPALLSASTIYDENGEVAGSNTCIIDVTEIHNAKERLEEANKKLIELDRMKTDFISIASHELRTPIQPILGFAELAKKGSIAYERANDMIIFQAKRLLRLASDILDTTRLDDDKMVLEKEKFSVNEVIRGLVDGRINGGQVKLNLNLCSDNDAIVSADISRIVQTISNIFENAIKFTQKGSIELRTRLVGKAPDSSKKYVEILISDTGPGIPAGVLPRLFNKFATLSVNRGTDNGTGLGLYICRGIARAHGGLIIAGNNLAGGAAFKIWLPAFVDNSNNISSSSSKNTDLIPSKAISAA